MIVFDKIALTTASTEFVFDVYPKKNSPYILLSATGLGPMPVEVNTTSTILPGSVYSGTQIQEREVVVTFRLNPDWKTGQSYSELRNRLYSTLSGGRGNYVTVTIGSGEDQAELTGYVNNIDVSIYTRTPEVQISIRCPNPLLRSTKEDVYYASESSTTVGEETWWEYSASINNEDAAPTGFVAEAALQTHITTEFELETTLSEKLRVVGPPSDLTLEDSFVINTNSGTRDVTSVRYGNFIGFLMPDSKWPILSSTTEDVVFRSKTKAHGVQFKVRKQWWGI